jgi:hypothetical protein
LAYRVIAVARTCGRSVSFGGFASGAEYGKSKSGGIGGQRAGIEIRWLVAGPKS